MSRAHRISSARVSREECVLSSIGRKFIQESILPSVKGALIGTLQIEINSDQILSNVGF